MNADPAAHANADIYTRRFDRHVVLATHTYTHTRIPSLEVYIHTHLFYVHYYTHVNTQRSNIQAKSGQHQFQN